MHFARYGIPDVVVSDNGPQFAAQEFQRFSKTWQFQLNTTSPHYPKSNGKAENAVKAAKQLLKKAKKDKADAYLALLAYRNTRTQGLDTSPAQRLISRRTKTLLPTTASLLRPQITEDLHQKLLFNKNVRQSTTTEERGHLQALIPVIQSECIMDPARPKIRNYSRPQSGPKSARGLMKSLPKMEKRSTEIGFI